MTTIALWYLVTLWGNAHTSATIPMQNREACVKAMQANGNYCINTQTGEVIQQ